MNDQLKATLGQWVDRGTPRGADIVLENVADALAAGNLTPARGGGRRRSLAVAFGAALFVLVALGLLPLLLVTSGSPTTTAGPSEPSITTSTMPATPTSVASTTSSGDPEPPDGPGPSTTALPDPPVGPIVTPPTAGWLQVDGTIDRDLAVAGRINAVLVHRSTVLAIGETCAEPGNDCKRSSWRSTDGVDWDRTDFDGGGTWNDAVDFNGLLVAGGQTVDGEICAPAVWTSSDGVVWSPTSTSEFSSIQYDGTGGQPCPVGILDIVDHDGRLFSVGAAADSTAAMWTSDDGREWVRVPTSADPWPPNGVGFTSSVFSIGRSLVVTGSCLSFFDCPTFPGTFWVSTDSGGSWRSGSELDLGPDENPVFFGNEIGGGTSSGVTLAVGGTVCDTEQQGDTISATRCTPAIWRTGDGVTWAADPLPGSDSDRLGFIATDDLATTVLGYGLEPPPSDGRRSWNVWRSGDGGAWTVESLAATTGTELFGSATVGSTMIVVGTNDAQSPVIWLIGLSL